MRQPIFSIIVPVYKVEEYLERCISTIVNQTLKDIEIILIDDGSPDRCPEICDQYAREDCRIIVIHKENGGLSSARNIGVEKATGKYVMFVDSDDYIELDCCQSLLLYTQKNVDVIVIDGIVEGEKVNLIHTGVNNDVVYKGMEFLKEAIGCGHVPMASWLYIYSREFLETYQLRFKEGILHEDEEFTPRALLCARTTVYTGIANYHYIIRNNSITTKIDQRKNAMDLYETCEELCSLYNELNDEELKCWLKDALVNKYLSLFQKGKLYQYGAEYLHKEFLITNAYRSKTRIKVMLYKLSPRIYWYINRLSKIKG